jgi:hypothetical protein
MHHAARRQVVHVAGVQREERLPGVGRILAAVDERLVPSDDRRRVALHHPRRALVLRDAQQLRILRHDRVGEIRQTLACDHVLIDADAAQVRKSLRYPGWSMMKLLFDGAADEKVADDRRPADDPPITRRAPGRR